MPGGTAHAIVINIRAFFKVQYRAELKGNSRESRISPGCLTGDIVDPALKDVKKCHHELQTDRSRSVFGIERVTDM